MNFEKRAELTLKMWALMMAALVLTMLFTAGNLGVFWSFGIAALIIGAGITTTGFMWNWGDTAKFDAANNSSEIEDAKRNRLALALRDLSDSELARLQQRLSEGDIDERQLARLLDEHSELEKVKR